MGETIVPKSAINGVTNFLKSKTVSRLDRQKELVMKYSSTLTFDGELNFENACVEIQKDFSKFVRWVNNYLGFDKPKSNYKKQKRNK